MKQKGMLFTKRPFARVKRVYCRGEPCSPADFAKAKSVAVRRKYRDFPSENPKIKDFRRAINDRPYSSDGDCAYFVKSKMFYLHIIIIVERPKKVKGEFPQQPVGRAAQCGEAQSFFTKILQFIW